MGLRVKELFFQLDLLFQLAIEMREVVLVTLLHFGQDIILPPLTGAGPIGKIKREVGGHGELNQVVTTADLARNHLQHLGDGQLLVVGIKNKSMSTRSWGLNIEPFLGRFWVEEPLEERLLRSDGKPSGNRPQNANRMALIAFKEDVIAGLLMGKGVFFLKPLEIGDFSAKQLRQALLHRGCHLVDAGVNFIIEIHFGHFFLGFPRGIHSGGRNARTAGLPLSGIARRP